MIGRHSSKRTVFKVIVTTKKYFLLARHNEPVWVYPDAGVVPFNERFLAIVMVVSYGEVNENDFEVAYWHKKKPIIFKKRLVIDLRLKEGSPVVKGVTPDTSELGFTPSIPYQQKSLDHYALFIKYILYANQRVGMTTHDTLCSFEAGRVHDELLVVWVSDQVPQLIYFERRRL